METKKIKEAIKNKAYYDKPSKKRREKKNMAILRNKYKVLKEKEQKGY